MNGLKHVLACGGGVFFLLILPFLRTDYFQGLLADGGVEAVSSASVVLDQPSGQYAVLINQKMHPDDKKLAEWICFFQGEDISYIFEDLSCSVADGDTGAMEMARSFQSRLPEHQMEIYTEDAILTFSRVDSGKYDIVIVSKEFAEVYEISFASEDMIYIELDDDGNDDIAKEI